MQNSVISTWFTSLYGSQPSSVVFACKTATFGPVYESLWVPDLTCRFVPAKQRDLHLNIKLTWVPASICCFVHAKQRLLEQNYKCVWVPALICGFVHANSDFSTWITSLYCCLPSSEVFACKPATFGPELQVSMGTRPHLSLCACITAPFGTELQVSMVSRPHLWFWVLITACLAQE